MRRLVAFLALLFFVLVCQPLEAVQPQIEFTAELENIDDSSDPALLTMRLTPSFSLVVQVTELTEIKSEDGLEIQLADLEVGQILEVEGVFTEGAIVALEIRVAGDVAEFELRGVIEAVDESERTIEVRGFLIQVPPEAEIKDEEGNQLAFSELEVGRRVKVEGVIAEGALVAREVRVLTEEEERFAQVRFRGVVTAIADDETIQVTIEGGIPVRVLLTPETKIQGTLAVGVLVRVFGNLTPQLAVLARRIQVERLIQLAPPRLRMKPNQLRRVVVILRSPFEEDAELALASLQPDVAEPIPDTLVIPADRLTGFFTVLAGPLPGETVVEVSLPEALGGLTVELPVVVSARDDDEEDELEVSWRPDEIRSADEGFRNVRLELNQPAPEDLIVELSLEEGGDVAFPSQVMIPAGDRAAPVLIEILSPAARARIRAQLPADLGGDSDDLEIDLTEPDRVRLDLRWMPDRIQVPVGTEVAVRLTIDRPAPDDFSVILRRQSGNSFVIEGLPTEVEFEEGETEVEVRFVATRRGTVRIRAALPLGLGGRHDDLRVEVR